MPVSNASSSRIVASAAAKAAPTPFDVCNTSVVLRAMLLVAVSVLTTSLFIPVEYAGWKGWIMHAGLGLACAQPAVLLWLMVVCMCKNWLARQARHVFFQLTSDLRAGFVDEFFDISAAAHKGIGLICQRADKAFCDQLVQTVDRKHRIDILVDVGVVKSAVCYHQFRGWRVEWNHSVGEVSRGIEWRLRFYMDSACRNECNLAFVERLFEFREYRFWCNRNEYFRLHSFFTC